ncbi:MAG: hypothetical protein K8R77_06800, partial [Anaerolineaceae bacterium]|nr:hypothetical protein [Anaerolineaceae bacterium]
FCLGHILLLYLLNDAKVILRPQFLNSNLLDDLMKKGSERLQIIIGSIFDKTEGQGEPGDQLALAKQKPKKSGPNIPKMLDLESIDYYTLPPAPSRWEATPQEINYPGKEFFIIAEYRDEQVRIAEARKMAIAGSRFLVRHNNLSLCKEGVQKDGE